MVTSVPCIRSLTADRLECPCPQSRMPDLAALRGASSRSPAPAASTRPRAQVGVSQQAVSARIASIETQTGVAS